MGKETNDLNKKATKYFINLLNDGKGLTFSEMVIKARLEFGYTDRWVTKFLSDFEGMIINDEGGFLRWKK